MAPIEEGWHAAGGALVNNRGISWTRRSAGWWPGSWPAERPPERLSGVLTVLWIRRPGRLSTIWRAVLIASITDSLVHLATNAINNLGLGGIFVLMLAESACIPIPSEATMLFAGFSVSQGHFSLLAITAVGVAGNLVGSWLSYAVGYFGRIELVERHAGKLHIKPHHVAWADRWFTRYGEATVFFTRMLPIIRTFISLPAGIARMPIVRFTVFTLLGCIPWVFLLGFVGQQVGHSWTQWKNAFSYVDYVVVALAVIGIVYLIARRLGWLGSGKPHARAGAGNERRLQASQQDGTGPEHEAGLGRVAADGSIAATPPVARVRGDAAKSPREPNDRRKQP